MRYLKKIKDFVSAYISLSNDNDLLKYENQLLLYCSVPVMLMTACANLLLVTIFDSSIIHLALVNSLMMLGFAFLLLTIEKLLKNENKKTIFYISIYTLSLIILVVRFYSYVGPTVWTIAFTAVLISMSRNNKLMMKVISATILILGVYVSVADLNFNNGILYRISQFVAFAILFIIGSTIQYISSQRYHKIKEHLSQTELLSKITFEFISINSKNFDNKIDKMLKLSGQHCNVDRTLFFQLSKDQKKIICTHEWCALGVKSRKMKTSLSVSDAPGMFEQIRNRNIIVVSSLEQLPLEATRLKEILFSMNVKSFVTIPVVIKDEIGGFLIFESIQDSRNWSEENKKMLSVMANSLGDAISRVESEKVIKHMAFYDPLTDLPNRALFHERLEKTIAHAQQHEKQIFVMYIDLDSFKIVNDTLGHQAGDTLLVQVARKLSACLGEGEFVARFGGDEFVVLIPDVNHEDGIQNSAEKIMASFNESYTINNHEFFVTASAGIAVYPFDGDDANMLIKNADMAMYSSKEQGNNLFTFCSPVMKEDLQKKVQITNLLYRAQEKNELILYYQPQVSVQNREIIGLEALLRWQNPEHGMIPPSVFIPLAEQTGLIHSIGQWVLETACRQNKSWQDMNLQPVRMAVNLSVEQFRNPNLVEIVSKALSSTGLSPEYLELEITESVAIRETNYIKHILTQLKNLGVTISIDDFGTEYSSLARLKQLPIDRIKMAMQFVHGIANSDKDEAIAKVIINLAKNLGLKVIAEGVETNIQLDFLVGSICDEVQGYYFYKPMPAAEIQCILENTSLQ